jgi:hypothetical protein
MCLARVVSCACCGSVRAYAYRVRVRVLSSVLIDVCVDQDTTVRVTDFGLSRLRQDTEESYATTKSNVGPVVRPANILHIYYIKYNIYIRPYIYRIYFFVF